MDDDVADCSAPNVPMDDSGCCDTSQTSNDDTLADRPSNIDIAILGGNFIQPNILGKEHTTYNNSNTTISACSSPRVPRKRKKMICYDHGYWKWKDMRNPLPWDKLQIPLSEGKKYGKDPVYPTRPNGIRRSLILNVKTFRDNSHYKNEERIGSDVDCANMENAFHMLGFEVSVECDKTAAEMKSLLQDFAKSRDNERADMVAVYIGSHGAKDECGDDTFVGSDGERVKFSEVKELFQPSNSRHLDWKPKLFFLQFCRSDENEAPAGQVAEYSIRPEDNVREGEDTDPGHCNHEKSTSQLEPVILLDSLCAFATNAGSKAYRNTTQGSWFVQALIKVFQNNVGKEDLDGMMTKVNQSVSHHISEGNNEEETHVQISEVRTSLKKKVFF